MREKDAEDALTELSYLDNSDKKTRKRISKNVRETANEDPAALLGEVPLIEPHLEDPSAKVRENLLVALGKIAREYPEEVRPVVPKIEDLAVADTGDGREDGKSNVFEAQFALGMVAKEYPDVAAENISRRDGRDRTSARSRSVGGRQEPQREQCRLRDRKSAPQERSRDTRCEGHTRRTRKPNPRDLDGLAKRV